MPDTPRLRLSHGKLVPYTPPVKQHPGLRSPPSRGRRLYQYNIDAFSHKYNLSRGDTIKSVKFRILHEDFVKELKKKHPDKEKLNNLAKQLGKKGQHDYSDFGETPTLT